jgi:imidazolonepropionase-like amidohydrolase
LGHLCDCTRVYAAAIQQAVAAGVKCIEHGHLIDEPTAKLLADKGIWWSLQPLTYDADVFARMSPVSQKKALQVWARTENAYKLAKKYNIKTAFGTDILFDPDAANRQGAYLAKMGRWYTPAEALKMATADNAQLMALSGFINPYPGKLGVVEEGALADLLVVRWQSLGKYQARRRSRQKLCCDYERWHHLQRHSAQVRICSARG